MSDPPRPTSHLAALIKVFGILLASLVVIVLILMFVSTQGLGGALLVSFIWAKTFAGTPVDTWLRDKRPGCERDETARLEAYIRTGATCKLSSGASYVPHILPSVVNDRLPKSKKCPVELAITVGTLEVVTVLKKRGVDPMKCPGSVDELFTLLLFRSRGRGHGYFALHDANYLDFAYALHDANLRPSDTEKFLFDAAKVGSKDGVHYAVKRLGQPIDAIDSDGHTALYHALLPDPTLGSWETVMALMQSGANPNRAGMGTETPLAKGKRLYGGTKWQVVFENQVGKLSGQ